MNFKEDKTDYTISFFPSEEDGLGLIYKSSKSSPSHKKAFIKLGIAAGFLGVVAIFIFTPPSDDFAIDESSLQLAEETTNEDDSISEELAPASTENVAMQNISQGEGAANLSALTSASLTSPIPVVTKEEPIKTESRLLTLSPDASGNQKETKATIRKGDTLIGVLKRNGLGNREATLVSMEMDKIYKLSQLRPKQVISIMKNKDKTFHSVKITDKTGNTFSVIKDETGAYLPLTDEATIEIRRSTVSGTITGTFSETANELNISKAITVQLVKAFSDVINFRTDTKNGDNFELVFEERFNDKGENIGGSKLLFASLSSGGKTYSRYYFKNSSGVWDYYDEKGNRTKQAINVWPAGKNKVTSRFGVRRHPILLYPIHHSGIDVRMPIGTPIGAAADGKVTYVGTRGGYGKYIQIKHGSGYTTAYAHLNGYAKGLKAGDFVKQGSIIGYTGNTGRSTGPHLHFEVIKNGKKVDPLQKSKFFITEKLKGKNLKTFLAECNKIKPSYSVATAESSSDNKTAIQ